MKNPSSLKRTAEPSALARIKRNIFRIQAYYSIMCGYFCIEFINYMLKGKTIIYFHLMTLKITIKVIKRIFKNEINKIRDYFNNEIKERKDIIKKLNKYLVSFDYLNKIFIILSASFGTLSIVSYASVVG